MRKVACLALIVGLYLVRGHAAREHVTLRVLPNTIQAGQSVELACFIPLDPSHRVVEMGIEGFTASARTLDGDEGPRVFVRTFEHVPCDVGDPYCVVDGGREGAKGRLLVTGCS